MALTPAPPPNFGPRSRFLTGVTREGAHCDPNSKHNICNGVSVNKGKSLLYCCKARCCNVLGDSNNCGRCSHKCRLGERCCNGTCTNVLWNASHCGKCGQKCKRGVGCEIGYCGYAWNWKFSADALKFHSFGIWIPTFQNLIFDFLSLFCWITTIITWRR